ncbi:hypothetical protein FC99_GL002444 [Levilactobacillus koreensis JCM 16448]|uniref:Uncharacterized protein n=1 Tax=Levilactobacillus koreensis TaxID=637971 RepID=A0AAC8UVS5_9LACO|nr:hypothetical protein [Levilactobacillus koreensis]AKP64931.1 hypothetical protein ABN16_07910 [Levilactobacillus koreensis]KRK91293.1 hypothetical protein FC99_GL002444 [Levilactobacillus koreensis JCM 16448]
MNEVLTVIREFDLFGGDSSQYGIETPKINAQFVGVEPAMAFDVHNQPKLARQTERQLRTIENEIRNQFHVEMIDMGGGDINQTFQVFQVMIATFKQRVEKELLIDNQLELESLTTSGEWLLFWHEDAPLVKAKQQQQENLPKDF